MYVALDSSVINNSFSTLICLAKVHEWQICSHCWNFVFCQPLETISLLRKECAGLIPTESSFDLHID